MDLIRPKTENLEPHPAAVLFPLMGKGDLDSLAEDIRVSGLRQPILMHEGKVLDGRNRLVACRQAGVEPVFAEWNCAGSPTAFVVSQNLHRRHLSLAERNLIAVEASKLYETEARERQEASRAKSGERADRRPSVAADRQQRADTGRAVEKAARDLGVAPREVYKAKRVAQKAPVLKEAVLAGEASLDAAALLADEPVARQRELVAAGPKAIMEAAKAKRSKKSMRLSRAERAQLEATIAAAKPRPKRAPEPDPAGLPDIAPRFGTLVKRIDHAMQFTSGVAAVALICAARDASVSTGTELEAAEARYQKKVQGLVNLSVSMKTSRREGAGGGRRG